MKTVTPDVITSLSEPATGDVLTQKQAADMFGVNVSTIRAWQTAGRIPLHSINGRPRYLRAELLGVLEARLKN